MIPEKPSDLTKESQDMRNCVRTYVSRVCDGRTCILFLRKKAMPDKSFGTIEVLTDGTLLQAKAFANAHLDRDAQRFIRKWAQIKNLKIRTLDLRETENP